MTRKFQYFNPLWYIYVYFNPLWYSIVYSYMMLFLVNSLHRMKKNNPQMIHMDPSLGSKPALV